MHSRQHNMFVLRIVDDLNSLRITKVIYIKSSVRFVRCLDDNKKRWKADGYLLLLVQHFFWAQIQHDFTS